MAWPGGRWRAWWRVTFPIAIVATTWLSRLDPAGRSCDQAVLVDSNNSLTAVTVTNYSICLSDDAEEGWWRVLPIFLPVCRGDMCACMWRGRAAKTAAQCEAIIVPACVHWWRYVYYYDILLFLCSLCLCDVVPPVVVTMMCNVAYGMWKRKRTKKKSGRESNGMTMTCVWRHGDEAVVLTWRRRQAWWQQQQ